MVKYRPTNSKKEGVFRNHRRKIVKNKPVQSTISKNNGCVKILGLFSVDSVTQQPISCGEGYEIDNDLGRIHLTYAIDCEIEDVTNITAWFSDLKTTPQMKAYQGFVSWGDMTENGWREFNSSADYYSLTTP